MTECGRMGSGELLVLGGVVAGLSTFAFLHYDTIFLMAYDSDYQIPAMSALALHGMYWLQ
jgi:fluoride ion exporter CrcB/FEX